MPAPALLPLNILISKNSEISLALPLLQTIGGDVDGEFAMLTAIDLPPLTTLGGSLRVDSPILTSVSLPHLTRVTGEILLREQLPSWASFGAEDPLHECAAEQMRVGVSTRRYGRSCDDRDVHDEGPSSYRRPLHSGDVRMSDDYVRN